MGKVGIVAVHNLHLMQFLYKYTEILDEAGIDYDVLYWNRDGVEYPDKFKGNAIGFQYLTSNYCPKHKKIIGFLKCRSFFKKKIKENQYEKLILLTTQTAVALADVLLFRYKGKYIYDYRDITMEDHAVYKKMIQKLIQESYFTAVSSKGFLQKIGNSRKILMSHNCRSLVSKPRELVKPDVLHITFWGMIRQVELQKKVCDFFGGDERFKIYYHGEGETEELIQYCKEKSYTNVCITGRYFLEEIPDFVTDTQILLNLYENDKKQKLATTVKLYDGIRYQIPMIIARDSYMQEYIGEKSFAYYFSFQEGEKENILEWYNNLSSETLGLEFQELSEQIGKDDAIFKRNLLRFAKGEK